MTYTVTVPKCNAKIMLVLIMVLRLGYFEFNKIEFNYLGLVQIMLPHKFLNQSNIKIKEYILQLKTSNKIHFKYCSYY